MPLQFERFEPAIHWESLGIRFELTQDIAIRMQARHASTDRMIQLKNGRLSFNWLGNAGHGYPSYENVRPEFEEVYGRFRDFLSCYELGELRPNQWEVTYLNHMPRETVWNGSGEWARPFRLLVAFPGKPAGTKAESFGGEWHYEIEPHRGRLHVQLKNAWRKRDEVDPKNWTGQ